MRVIVEVGHTPVNKNPMLLFCMETPPLLTPGPDLRKAKLLDFLPVVGIECSEADLEIDPATQIPYLMVRRIEEYIERVQNLQNRIPTEAEAMRSLRDLSELLNCYEWTDYLDISYPTFLIKRAANLYNNLTDDGEDRTFYHCLNIVLEMYAAELNMTMSNPNEPPRAMFFGERPEES